MNAPLHPLIAGILSQAAELPLQVRRAEYASRLIKFDWQFEHAPAEQWRRGRDELRALVALRAELDPTHKIWNRHAPEGYRTLPSTVRAFCDFTGPEPVTVEWAEIDGAPRVIAVVVNVTDKVVRPITDTLTPARLDELQAKLNELWAGQIFEEAVSA